MEPIDYLVLIAIVGLPLGVVALYLKTIRSEMLRFQYLIGKQIDDHETRLRQVEEGRVTHADWLRGVASQRNSLDATRRQLGELSGKLDASLGIGVGIQKLCGILEKQTEAQT